MSWSTAPSAADVRSEFTASEASALTRLQGGADNLPVILDRAIAEVRDAIRAGGYDLDADGTLPLGLHSDCIAIARWRWLITLPDAAKPLQTEGRKAAFEAAQKKLSKISNQEWAVEPPDLDNQRRYGNWNSENKIVPRTHPVPRPARQYSPQDGRYANPDGPLDNP
jgi:hypothetical protein